MNNDDLIKEARKALTCLYITVDAQVAEGMSCVIEPALTALENCEKENAKLREALKPFADAAVVLADDCDNSALVLVDNGVLPLRVYNLRKAKEVLGE